MAFYLFLCCCLETCENIKHQSTFNSKVVTLTVVEGWGGGKIWRSQSNLNLFVVVLFCVYGGCACNILLWNGIKYFVSKCMIKHNIIKFVRSMMTCLRFVLLFLQKRKVRTCVCVWILHNCLHFFLAKKTTLFAPLSKTARNYLVVVT